MLPETERRPASIADRPGDASQAIGRQGKAEYEENGRAHRAYLVFQNWRRLSTSEIGRRFSTGASGGNGSCGSA